MADIAVENKETPIVEKEVDDNETPKVSETEEVDVGKTVENGTTETAEEATENGSEEKADEEEADDESTNGESTDAPAAEAVKRKGDATDATPADEAATPEKKAKLDDSAAAKEVEANGAPETEVAA